MERVLLEVEVPALGTQLEVEIPAPAHECAPCGRSFASRAGLNRHARWCAARGRDAPALPAPTPRYEVAAGFISPHKAEFKCAECKKNFKYKKSFDTHTKEIHSRSPKSVKCPKCPAKCANNSVLRKHLKTHAETKTSCPHCKQTFSRSYHLTRHLEQKGCDGKNRPSFMCEVCLQTFTRKDNLLIHLRWHISKHTGQGFQCRQCLDIFRSQTSLVRHHMKVHEGSKFECDMCGKVLMSRMAFIKHLEGVHGEKKYICNTCNFRCKSLEILRRHALRHSAKKPHQCLLCERSFIQVHELTAHTFKHTGHSSIVCNSCGTAFPTKNSLRYHEMKVHENAPALFCLHENCKSSKKPFFNQMSFRIHMKSHSMNKPFKCPKCDKTFHLKAALSSHVLTHQFERPRRCTYCTYGRAYIRGDLLLRHLRIKHPDLFQEKLSHVRKVLGIEPGSVSKMTKAETNALINMIDALQEQNYSDIPIDINFDTECDNSQTKKKSGVSSVAVLCEEELVENMKKMIVHLIDKETLDCLGWPEIGIDELLERVLQQCGQNVADTNKYTRAQCLRENTKQLFLKVIEEDTITRMMNTKSIDEVIRHIVSASE